MYKTGRNAKLIILLVADQTQRKPPVNRLLEIMHGFTTLYNVRLANEKTLYSTYIQESCEKLVIILFNETGLKNRQFRECIRTSLAAKINIIGVIDETMTKERILSFFTFSGKRRQTLEDIIDKAAFFEKGTQFSATALMNRIQNICRPISGFPRRIFPKITESSKLDLETCLNLKKVVLKPVHNQTRHHQKQMLSYNLSRTTELPPLLPYGNSRIVSGKNSKTSRYSGKTARTGVHETITCPKIEVVNVSAKQGNISSTSRKERIIPVVNKKITCPTIEISREEEPVEVNPDGITETQTRLPWTTTPALPSFLSTGTEENNNGESNNLNEGSQITRRFSFDYISKTYIVCDPKYKKALYVNFPSGLNMMKRDSASDILRSLRKNSLSLNSSVHSSTDEINLECVFDPMYVFESPIPSPILKKTSFIYQNPLPVYPDENCFPPLETFPCDMLQLRRPSVFDVLLH